MLFLCKRELTAIDLEREKNDQHTIGIQVKTGEGTTLTHVPAAVVVDPASVSLPPMQPGEVFQGELTLTNHGLIRADHLHLLLPDDNGYFRSELLGGVPDSLGAKQRVTVPYRVTMLHGFEQEGSGDGTGGGCELYLMGGRTRYDFTCVNGHLVAQYIPECFDYDPCRGDGDDQSGSSGSSSGSTTDEWITPLVWKIRSPRSGDEDSASGSGTAGGSPTFSSSPETLAGTPCYPTCQGSECSNNSSCQECGKKETCQHGCTATSSSVNHLSRGYRADAPGLSVTVPGGSLRVAPVYWEGTWLFGPDRSGLDGLPTETSTLQFFEYGDEDNGYVITAIIKDGNISYNLPPEHVALRKEYDAQGSLISERYAYVGDRIYRHEGAYTLNKTETGYRWKEKSGDWQDYDEHGRLTAVGNRHGPLATVLYDDEGRVTGYRDQDGTQVIWVTYQNDRIASLRDADGRQVDYTYDPSTGSGQVDRLWKVTDHTGDETTYAYDGDGRLQKVSTPGGREANISYGPDGGVQSVTDEEGEGSTFAFDYDKRKKEYYAMVTFPSGTIKEVWYDEDGNTKRVAIDGETVQTIQQDPDRNALIITDADGQETRKEYDEWDNLKKISYPDGTETTYTYDRPYHQLVQKNDCGVISTSAYNDDGALTRSAEAVGTEQERITEYTYNAEGNRTHMRLTENAGSAMEVITEEEYDADGNRTRLVEAVGTAFERKTEYAYTDGNLTSIIKYLDESTTVETTMEYDEDGNLKKKIDPSGETSYTYTEDGNIDTVTTVQGTWEYEYDTEGRLSVVTDPFNHTRSREYDENGNVNAVKVNGKTVSTYTYDTDGNLIERTDAEGHVYQFDYNADGQLVGQTDPEGASFQYEYDANGRLSKTIGGNGNEIFREYGSDDTSSSGSACLTCGTSPLEGGQGGGILEGGQGGVILEGGQGGVSERLQRIIYPTFTKEFRYDDEGRVSEEIYTLNGGETSSVTYAYDQFGRLQSTTGPDGRRIRVDDPSGSTRFEYDNWDNLVALTDAKNQRTEFEYDPSTSSGQVGRLKKEIRPMSEETTYEYYPAGSGQDAGRLWKMVDAKNQITEYGYDNQGRLETIARSGPGVQSSLCTLSYDADGNLAGYDDGTTSATYAYDDLGRKLSETVDYGTFTKEFFYTYYKNGLKKTFTMPDETMYEYSYGSNNELREVRIPGLGAITIPDYTWNRPAKMTFPGGTQRTYGYDALMRLKTLTATDPGGNPLLNYAYTYDEVGNILTKNTEHGNYTYEYDASSQLSSADNPALADESYTYDAVGNRLTSADVSGSWSYNANNELLGFADVEYEYDDNGNMTQISIAGSVVWTYTYDAANRLVHVEDGTGTITADYGYDPFGRRLWKEVGGTRTYFFYSEEGLIAEYDETGTEIRSYGYKPDSTWTTDPLWMKQDGAYYFYHNDHLGTPQKLVGVNGAVVWSAIYSSFGEADVQVETVTNNLRFPGQYYDEETGLHYNYFRYYNPKIGRYLKKDPLGLEGGMNPFPYAHNNPLTNADPEGKLALIATTLLILMVATTVVFIVDYQYILTTDCYVRQRHRTKTRIEPRVIPGVTKPRDWK